MLQVNSHAKHLWREKHPVKNGRLKKCGVCGMAFLLAAALTGCAAPEDTAAIPETAEALHTEESMMQQTETQQVETQPAAANREPVQLAIPELLPQLQVAQAAQDAQPLTLELLEKTDNQISFAEDWVREKGLFLPLLSGDETIAALSRQLREDADITYDRWQVYARSFYDENYIYAVSENVVLIHEKETEELLYELFFEEKLGEDYGIWAKAEDGILYVNQYYNGYAYPGTDYLMAIDLTTGQILWRSADQTCNTRNFLVKGDVILCGYGFTDEDDYLYQIDKHTGKVIAQTALDTQADYLIEQEGKIYVHTYNRDYIFNVQ